MGVVVNSVRLSNLGEFGSPQFVADKLIQAERRKVTASFNAFSTTSLFVSLS